MYKYSLILIIILILFSGCGNTFTTDFQNDTNSDNAVWRGIILDTVPHTPEKFQEWFNGKEFIFDDNFVLLSKSEFFMSGDRVNQVVFVEVFDTKSDIYFTGHPVPVYSEDSYVVVGNTRFELYNDNGKAKVKVIE